MEKIVEYVVVANDVGSIQNLMKIVNDKIRDGFEPFGSAFAVTVNPSSTQIFQPMVKKGCDKTPAEFR